MRDAPSRKIDLVSITGAFLRFFQKTKRRRTIVIGANARMRLLAAELGNARRPVSLIQTEVENTIAATTDGDLNLVRAVEPDEAALSQAAAESAIAVVAGTSDYDLNLLLCHIAQEKFRVPIAIARMRMFPGLTSWARVTQSGMTRLDWAQTVKTVLRDLPPSAGFARVAMANDLEQLVDAKLIAPVFIGRTTTELPLLGCEVIALSRNGVLLPNLERERLRAEDVLTVIGPNAAINRLRESLASL